MSELENPVPRIVDAVAEAEDVDALALEPPLADVVDPDALESLLEETSTSTLEIQFRYQGHDVLVDANGLVQVD
ncbi:hypothetical protein G9C85_14720 [Halorubellus sp. JP-L1]|uniref:HalOD1 output domain-containing protein n=1 Tax=Halorubellus sp. JP-L1 TaxID=2715753 RepID=UPI0014074FF5|nr:HalOD1 output domain-containing protein [Halorubellus sp. JP-L1]NHN42871.1 hypothetical protein [Halorubellus sp. JP-L1]